MFATGVENSYPTIASGKRIDEMEKCGHYRRWKEDLGLAHELGLEYLRWGPPLFKTHVGPGQYDWDWTDDVLAELAALKINPIVDLCHFGVPDWIGNFQNRDFPPYFAEYAGEFARRHPEIRYSTPINEMLITTLFSAKYGWWNERGTSDDTYVRATLNVCKANVLAMQAILKHVPEAVFIQSESSEYSHASRPDLVAKAHFLNERRFLPLDLNYAHCVCSHIYRYLI